ncbi:MAG: DMT family transporter [Bryobacteraceae bacterium]
MTSPANLEAPASTIKADLSLVLIACVWGATFVLVKTALNDVSTLLFLTLRFSLAAGALAIVFRRDLRLSPELAYSVKAGILAGFCLFSGYVLQTFGLKLTSASKAAFLTGLYIPLVPVLGALVYRKTPGASEVAGVIAAAIGMGLMTVQKDALRIGLGDLLVIGCAVAFAFHILVLGHFTKQANLGILTLTQIATGAVMGGLTCWWAEPARVYWTPNVWIALLVTSLLATALAFALQTWAQRHTSATRTALIFALEPVFAWATSYFLAGEVLSPRAMAGAALILGGLLIVELKPFGLTRHPLT